jgi:hypothetical protein
MFRPTPQTTAQSSVYLSRSHSLVLLFLFPLFNFIFLFLSFPRLFLAAYMCTSSAKRKKSLVPAGGPNGCQVQTKQTGPPSPCSNSQEIPMESMPVLLLEESWTNTLTQLLLLLQYDPSLFPMQVTYAFPTFSRFQLFHLEPFDEHNILSMLATFTFIKWFCTGSREPVRSQSQQNIKSNCGVPCLLINH